MRPHARFTTTCRIACLCLGLCLGCKQGTDTPEPDSEPAAEPEAEQQRAAVSDDAPLAQAHRRLLDKLRAQGIDDARVLHAIAEVPRHELVPPELRELAYVDRPLPIGAGQTISQPYVVALMTQLAQIEPGDRVLEVGTGSGYQTAVLAEISDEVYTIEIIEPLARRARAELERLGYADEVEFRVGDGYAGWPEAAPFDAIVVTAAPPEVPEPLSEQLKVGGRLVIPVGELDQQLQVIERTQAGLVEHDSIPVRFVPMTGRAQDQDQAQDQD